MDSFSTSTSAFIKFKFDNIESSAVVPINKMQNLIAPTGIARCYTPNVDIFSPGLSPIFNFGESSLQENEKNDNMNNNSKKFAFLFPQQSSKQYIRKLSPKSSTLSTNEQQRSKQLNDTDLAIENNGSFELINLSTSTNLDSLDNSSNLDISKTSFSMDRNLNVSLLLKDIGLGQYSEKFAKEGIGLEAFLKLKLTDLQNMGLQSEEHCKAITDMLNGLNSVVLEN